MTAVRRGTERDLPRLRAIQAAALAEPWPELLAAAAAGAPDLFVCTDGDPLGYAIVVAGETAYCPELAVRPDRQGEGHGSRLLAAVADRLAARGCTELRLTVLADDDRARSFYTDRGFERIDRLPDHFDRGDGLVLSRPL
jgi:ribosomal-protein-alanine N-acetyltransferase